MPAAQAWLPAERLSANSMRSASSSPGTRSTTMRRSSAAEGPALEHILQFGKTGCDRGPRCRHGGVARRAAHQDRQQDGHLEFSDPSGHYEAVIFQEGLMQYRDLLEPGKAVLLMLTAEAQGEDVRARIRTVEPLDAAAEKMQKGLRVSVDGDQPIEGVARRLSRRAPAAHSPTEGGAEMTMCSMLDRDTDVEVRLRRYEVRPDGRLHRGCAGVVQVKQCRRAKA